MKKIIIGLMLVLFSSVAYALEENANYSMANAGGVPDYRGIEFTPTEDISLTGLFKYPASTTTGVNAYVYYKNNESVLVNGVAFVGDDANFTAVTLEAGVTYLFLAYGGATWTVWEDPSTGGNVSTGVGIFGKGIYGTGPFNVLAGYAWHITGFYYDTLAPADVTGFNITAYRTYFGDSINVFNVSMESSEGTEEYQTTSGLIETTLYSNSTALWNITFTASNFTTYTRENFNISANLNQNLSYAYYYLNLSVYYAFTNASASEFNVSINGTVYENLSSPVILTTDKDEDILINVTKEAYLPTSFVLTPTQWEYTAGATLYPNFFLLNITSYGSGTYLENFTVTSNVTGINGTATGEYLLLQVPINTSYNFTIDAEEYALNSQIVAVTNWTQRYNQTLVQTNSISITIRDENTNLLITENVTALFTYSLGQFNASTTNGTMFVSDLFPDSYVITFDSDTYEPRNYEVTISNRSTQTLTAYLTTSTFTTIFTAKDSLTSTVIEGASAIMYRILNGSWTPIESKSTDITGKAQFTYIPNVNYRFYFSKTNYEDLIFTLTPVLFSEYDINMDPIVTINETVDYERTAAQYSPKLFYENNNTFTFLIGNAYGELESYGYVLTYPGGSTSNNGVNAIGEQLTSNFNITGAQPFDTIQVNYYFTTTVGGFRNFTYYHPITVGAGNNTFINTAGDPTYGLGILERVFILTLVVLFLVGLSALVGQILAGLLVSLGVLVFLVSTGFISIWIIALPVVLSLFIIMFGGRT